MAKICGVCKEIKEIHEFVKDNKRTSGYGAKCKECHANYNKKYVVDRRKANAKHKQKLIIHKKYCDTCFEEKNINEYAKCFSSQDDHRNKCKNCSRKETTERHNKRINSFAQMDFIICTQCNVKKQHKYYALSGLRRIKTLCKECFNDNYKKTRKSISQVCHLSHEDYKKLLEKQNFSCAICKLPETRILKGKLSRLVVDHCHKKEYLGINEIRGLLCSKCNSGLGWFQDSVSNLKEAIIYLESQN